MGGQIFGGTGGGACAMCGQHAPNCKCYDPDPDALALFHALYEYGEGSEGWYEAAKVHLDTMVARGAAHERARIVAAMRTEYPMNRHAQEWADWIERNERDGGQ